MRHTAARGTVRYPHLFEDQSKDETGEQAPVSEETQAEELVVPEDLTGLSSEELTDLHGKVVEAFNGLRDDEAFDTDEGLEQMSELADAAERLNAQIETLGQEAKERKDKADALASRMGTPEQEDTGETSEGELSDESGTEEEPDAGGEDGTETFSAESENKPREVRMSLSRISNRQRKSNRPAPENEAGTQIQDLMKGSPDLNELGGKGLTFNEAGNALDRRLASFNPALYRNAGNRRIRQEMGLVSIQRPVASEFMINSDSPQETGEVLERASNERRLPGNSLVASGGWGSPSETLWGLYEEESTDGLLSIAEVGINRGGIRYTTGVDFADIFASDAFFDYSEQDDIDGNYDGAGGGEKPVYRVDTPTFKDERLRSAGLIIEAGLLQQRGYPEYVSRSIRGALVAHEHHMNARVINSLVNKSTAVTMRTGTVGTVAPLLTSMELHAEHMKDQGKLARGTTIEAVAPYWLRNAFRADLALRSGVNMLSVTDAQIAAWFAERGVSVQYVYDWQGRANVKAADLQGFPESVKILMYPAGTWIKGVEPVLTLNTLYDSALLKHNDYTALFTEDGWLTVKYGGDSRVIESPICNSGATHGGVAIDCDGTVTP